jgi:hypothetical protein
MSAYHGELQVYNRVSELLDGEYDGERKQCLAVSVADKPFQMVPTDLSFSVWHGTVLALMIKRLTLVEGPCGDIGNKHRQIS